MEEPKEEVRAIEPQEIILRVFDPSKRSILLDDDRESFCRYVVARNGIEKSYQMAYNIKGGKEVALLLLENPEVCARINQLERERVVMRNLTKESLIVGLKDIYDVSIADYFNTDFDGLTDSETWTPAMRSAMKKIKFGKFGVEFEIADKVVVADKIISMMGYNEPLQREEDSGLSKFTDQELEDMATMDIEFEEVKETKKIE
jgi:hypothetical protein